MGKLVYGMFTSLDSYVTGPDGKFDWATPDEETHRFANQNERDIGTFLYGRRMFETMQAWADDGFLAEEPPVMQEYAEIWRAADKVVFSTTLKGADLPRTTIRRRVDLQAIVELKRSSVSDVSVSGPTVAADMLRAGLVDEITPFVCPVVVGAGTRFLPEQLNLDLELVDQRRFGSGVVFLRYAILPGS